MGVFCQTLVITTGCIVGLFSQGRGSGMGSERHLFRHDAVHGVATDWPHPDYFIPTNCVVVAYLYLRRRKLVLRSFVRTSGMLPILLPMMMLRQLRVLSILRSFGFSAVPLCFYAASLFGRCDQSWNRLLEMLPGMHQGRSIRELCKIS